MTWWQSKPVLFEEFKRQLSEFPYLNLIVNKDRITILGDWHVYGKNSLITTYKIKIEVPDDYPESLPKVFEVDDCLPKIQDRHFNAQDESACLFLPLERNEHWPPGSGIDVFLNGPVKEFFFSQAYFDLTGEWAFGEWGHGLTGIAEYILIHLNLKSLLQAGSFLRYVDYQKPTRQWKCPCESGERFMRCHWDEFAKIKDRLSSDMWTKIKKNIKRI